jgi:FixJ family two-component response regulator
LNESIPLIHVVDDDPSFLKAVSRFLGAAGFSVKKYGSASEFLSLRPLGIPGCVVADLRMPEQNGLDLQAALAASPDPLPVVFLSAHGDVPSTVRAMKQGAEDFLTKLAPKEDLLLAVRRALDRDARERRERERKGDLRARLSRLTQREQQVLALVVEGKPNKLIAALLGIHERTVKLHRTSITTKLDVHSVAELTRLAQDAGPLP